VICNLTSWADGGQGGQEVVKATKNAMNTVLQRVDRYLTERAQEAA